MSPLEKAIELAGGLTELARLIEVSPQVVNNWRTRGVPVDQCASIERALKGGVRREDFYPDHFGPIESSEAA